MCYRQPLLRIKILRSENNKIIINTEGDEISQFHVDERARHFKRNKPLKSNLIVRCPSFN